MYDLPRTLKVPPAAAERAQNQGTLFEKDPEKDTNKIDFCDYNFTSFQNRPCFQNCKLILLGAKALDMNFGWRAGLGTSLEPAREKYTNKLENHDHFLGKVSYNRKVLVPLWRAGWVDVRG